jgi:putative membrane protein
VVRFLISIVLHLVANAFGLIVAALILDDMSLDTGAFIIAVLIFTVVEVIAQPLLRSIAMKHVEPLLGSVALVTTFVGLLITELITDGLDIEGVWTWVLATVIVWLAALLAAIILPAIFLKKTVENVRSNNA